MSTPRRSRLAVRLRAYARQLVCAVGLLFIGVPGARALGSHSVSPVVAAQVPRATAAAHTSKASAAAQKGTVVSGTVSGSDQGFLKGALLVLDGSGRRETHTDADGRFTFVDVTRGQYRFAVSAEGYLPLEQRMEVGTASVSLDVVLLHIPGLP